jgi:hypothetical protein
VNYKKQIFHYLYSSLNSDSKRKWSDSTQISYCLPPHGHTLLCALQRPRLPRDEATVDIHRVKLCFRHLLAVTRHGGQKGQGKHGFYVTDGTYKFIHLEYVIRFIRLRIQYLLRVIQYIIVSKRNRNSSRVDHGRLNDCPWLRSK